MSLRLFVGAALAEGTELALPETAARHAQVRRVQPGDLLVLFDGQGREAPATVSTMGRSEVRVRVGAPAAVDRELPVAVTIALVMPANERMDWLVEKAGELGAAALQPLLGERSVLRPTGERAERRRAHWQGIAVAASEQCGRTRVMQVAPVLALTDWLVQLPAARRGERWLLAPGADASVVSAAPPDLPALCTLSGPEGGLSDAEQAAARAAGFRPLSLGPRVLRAETAPLAVLAWLGLRGG
ncbi:MAG: 16S rRNA (uracil(1498)-N(3))-methyltransferase [Rubrivivax sp.]|nr:16S rRNA (uracil(1498)-N(3))-methyltransferase [Rubrivivax sp.]